MGKQTNHYQGNATMNLLGKQTISEQIYENQSQLEDIISANKSGINGDTAMFMLAADAFSYGLILGKRIERAKKRSKRDGK